MKAYGYSPEWALAYCSLGLITLWILGVLRGNLTRAVSKLYPNRLSGGLLVDDLVAKGCWIGRSCITGFSRFEHG